VNAEAGSLTVFLRRESRPVAPEWAWGQRLCEEFLRASSPATPVVVFEGEKKFTIGDALSHTAAEMLGLVLDEVAFWDPAGWRGLCQVLRAAPHVAVVVPVSNETAVDAQRAAAPFVYHTPSLFRLACHSRRPHYLGQWREVTDVDPFAFLCRRADLERLDPHLPPDQVPARMAAQGRSLAVAYDTYVHRYGRMYEQARPDLQAWVPTEAERILDIGCAAGAFGAVLQGRQRCRVVGIELNPLLAARAAQRLDRVVQQSVEDLPESAFTEEFDCVVCGDVLEHLRDPWAVVGKLARWLKPHGRLIATVPNVGHWSIAADLLRGRWDLVPFSLLCWGHLRFFTRTGVEQLVRGHGLAVEHLQGTDETLPAVGEEFLRQIATVITDVDTANLRASEFLVVARKGTT
jgi:SAM-dependent methyltransferase